VKTIRSKIRMNPIVQKVRKFLHSPFASDLPFIFNHIDPTANIQEQIYWMEQLFEWINLSGELPKETETSSKNAIQVVRIKFLLHLVSRNPEWKTKLSGTLRSIVLQGSCLELFSQTGLHQEFGFWAEAADRVIKNVLPVPPDSANLSEFFGRVFSSVDAAEWFEEISPDMFLQITELFFHEADDPTKIFNRIYKDTQNAIVVLAATIGGIGLSRDLLRNRAGSPHDSPFYRLTLRVYQMISAAEEGHSSEKLNQFSALSLEEIKACRIGIREIFVNLEEKGVSVAVVYRLDQLQFALIRIETLIHLLFVKVDKDSMSLIANFLTELIREQYEARGLMPLFKSNMRLLSKKIVERTGVTGEHYITSTKPEYKAMLKSGCGGGLLTVFTMLAKTWISAFKLPFFWEFFGLGTNYALSFIGIQLFGFTLATKQPSATAAHLAGKLDNLNSQDKLETFVEEFKKIWRSQIAAAIGNVGMALPASAFMFFVYRIVVGEPLFTEEYALYTLHSLNPLESFTILYAAFTGVWLWISSLVGGWFENWIVYRRIPDAIAQSRGLRTRFGVKRSEGIANWLAHSASGFASNTALGFLLAGVPIFSRLFGIGFDVRHVTLSTCAMTFAACSLLNHPDLAHHAGMAFAGVLVIGALNLGVSFYLALTVAARARSLSQATVFFLFKEIAKAFFRGPREFFYPR
jgi:site-specific recombinase